MPNPCVPKSCKGNCTYDSKLDKCTVCDRTMDEIRAAYSTNNKVRM